MYDDTCKLEINLRRIDKPAEAVADAPQERSVLAVPFLPLLDLGNVICSIHPKFGDFVQRYGLALRAVAEVQLAHRVPDLLKILKHGGFNAYTRKRVRDRLLSNHVPVPIDRLLDTLAASYRDNVIRGNIAPEDPDRSILCGLVADSHVVFTGGKKPGRKRLWTDSDTLDELCHDIPIQPWDGEDISEVPEENVRYAMVAALELPSVASGRPFPTLGAHTGELFTRAARFGADDIRAVELTYLGEKFSGYQGRQLFTGPIDEPEFFDPDDTDANPGYRRTIEQRLPSRYFERVLPNQPNLKVFTFQPSVTGFFGDDIQKLLDDNKDAIQRGIDRLAEEAGDAAKAFLEGKGLPGDMGKKLVSQAVKTLGNSLLDIIFNVLAGAQFATWAIAHLVLWQPPMLPESTYRLASSLGNELLYPIRQTPVGTSELVEDENGRPFYPPFPQNAAPNDPNQNATIEFLSTGRFEMGPSGNPRGNVPRDLRVKVAAKGAVAAEWASTANNEGFHVVVSTPQTNGKGRQAWDLRAELRSSADFA